MAIKFVGAPIGVAIPPIVDPQAIERNMTSGNRVPRSRSSVLASPRAIDRKTIVVITLDRTGLIRAAPMPNIITSRHGLPPTREEPAIW